MNEEPEFLTVKEVVALHKGRIKERTVHERVRQGRLPHVRLYEKNRITIPSDALLRMEQQQEAERKAALREAWNAQQAEPGRN